MAGLASAVANEGGIGVIASAGIAMHDPDYEKNVRAANKRALANEVRKAKSLTKGPIGVNILVALSDYDALSVVCVEVGADVLGLGAGHFAQTHGGHSQVVQHGLVRKEIE